MPNRKQYLYYYQNRQAVMFEGRLICLNGGLLFEYMEYTEKVEMYNECCTTDYHGVQSVHKNILEFRQNG